MPRVSLLTKLLVAILAPTLLTFAGFAILGHIAASRALEAELGRRLASLAAVTAAQISEESVALLGPGDESSRTYRNLRRRLLDVRDAAAVSRVYLFAVDGTSRVDSADLPIGSRDYTLETSRSELRRVFPDGGRMGVAVSSLLFRGRDGALYKSGFAPIRPQTEGAAPQFAVGVDGSAALYADLLGLRQTLFSVGLLGALSLVVLAVGLGLRLTRPLRRLRESARLIGAGVFDQKVWQPDAARAGTGGGVTGGDEVAELARGLEAMRDGLRVRDERLQMMLAGIAHEVRNPLGGMELFAGLLAEELAAAPMGSGAAAGGPDLTAAQGYVARVQRELRHLQAVVSDFLEYARRPRPQLSRVGVADLLSDVRDSVVSTAQVRVQLAPVAADLCVRADPTQLRRALLNLAQNAVQACTDAQGGASRAADASFQVTLSAQAIGGQVQLGVCDNGPGIPDDVREKIWTPFFTTRAQGTGLGLAFVREIVEDHGGSIDLQTGASGTTFTLRLPKSTDASLGTDGPRDADAAAAKDGQPG